MAGSCAVSCWVEAEHESLDRVSGRRISLDGKEESEFDGEMKCGRKELSTSSFRRLVHCHTSGKRGAT